MPPELQSRIMRICDDKIAKKGENVGLSFYAFFANKNDEPEMLMQAAEKNMALERPVLYLCQPLGGSL